MIKFYGGPGNNEYPAWAFVTLIVLIAFGIVLATVIR